MESYQLLDVIEVHNKDYNGYCVQILVINKTNLMQKEIINCYVSEEEKNYIAQYGKEVPITDLFKVQFDFYKKSFKLKFNQNLLK